jgi:hypothetical protein
MAANKQELKKNKIFMLTIILLLTLAFNYNVLAAEKDDIDSVIKHGNVEITEGQIVKNVIVVGGKVSIAGTVREDVMVLGGGLEIKSTAKILGNIGVIGGEVKQSSQAEVTENIFNLELSTSDFDILLVGFLLLLVFMFMKYLIAIFLLLTNVLFSFLISEHIKSLSKVITDDFFKVSILGILGLILFSLLIIITAVTIIGSTVSILLLIIVLIVIVLGLNGLAYLIGEKISDVIAIRISSDLTIGIIGMVSLVLFWFIPILGSLFLSILAILSFGAVLYNILPIE